MTTYKVSKKEMVREEWRDVKGFEGLYQVSSFGNVKSFPRKFTVKKERILIPQKKIRGYLGVNLSGKNYRIHRLVAEAFIANPDNKTQVNHKNCLPNDNRLENLEWVTPKENIKHAFNNGLCENSCAKKRKKVYQKDLDGNIIRQWDSLAEVVRNLGISQGDLSMCCLGYRNKVKGYKWAFA